MIVEVTIYYLEMTDPHDLRPKRVEHDGLEIRQAGIPSPELNRFLYTAAGGDWYWIDRLNWTYQQWLEWVDRPELETWVAYISGTPAGFGLAVILKPVVVGVVALVLVFHKQNPFRVAKTRNGGASASRR